jgi:Glyoxalase-like domain
MEITSLTVDCRDPMALATFWNEALRWGGVASASDGSGATCGPPTGGTYLEFIRVPEHKVVKNRVHLGCSAVALADLDGEVSRCSVTPRETSSAWALERPRSDPAQRGGLIWPTVRRLPE